MVFHPVTTQSLPLAASKRSHVYLFAALFLMLCSGAATPAIGTALRYQYDGADYEGYYASKTPGAPLVLLLHDWDGLTDYEVRRAEMLADLGYAVLAADMFGAGVRPTTTEDKQSHTGALMADRKKMRGLMLAALDAAGKAGADKTNAVAAGYCLGGGATLELARSGANLKGYVSFHGVLATPEGQDYSNTKGEVLVLHGTADSAIPMAHFAALAEEMEAAGVANEMISYGGAPHGFTIFGAEVYDEEADKKSWQRFRDFLAEKLGPVAQQ